MRIVEPIDPRQASQDNVGPAHPDDDIILDVHRGDDGLWVPSRAFQYILTIQYSADAFPTWQEALEQLERDLTVERAQVQFYVVRRTRFGTTNLDEALADLRACLRSVAA